VHLWRDDSCGTRRLLCSIPCRLVPHPPYGSIDIGNPDNLFALLVFVLVGVAVAAVVDRSITISAEASQRRADAEVLLSLSAGVLGRKDPLRGLLEEARDSFAMECAALFEHKERSGFALIEAVGTNIPPKPEAADVTIEAGEGLVLALNGKAMSISDRRLLGAFASQTAALLERTRLAAQAADASRLVESDSIKTAILAAVSHDLRSPLAGIKASLDTLDDPTIEIAPTDRAALLSSARASTDRLVADGLESARHESAADRCGAPGHGAGCG